MSHEEIARRLREQGMVEAPPDLRDEVMRAVRAELHASAPRRGGFRLSLPAWRPVAVWVGVAACLLAAGVGVTRLGGGSGSSASAGSAAAPLAQSGGGNADKQAAVPEAQTLEFQSMKQARLVLGATVFQGLTRSPAGMYFAPVTASQLSAIRARYSGVAGHAGTSASNSIPGPARVRVLLRVRAP
jgi:hypothetical protein